MLEYVLSLKKLTCLILISLFFPCWCIVKIPFSNIKPLSEDFSPLSDFRRVVPYDSVSSPVEIEASLWHNRENLYLEIETGVKPKLNPGTFTADDARPEADYLRLQIITDVKNHYSYSFYFYPLGNRFDAIRKSDFSIDKYWNSAYNYESDFNDSLWTISARIPFRDLRFFAHPPYNWKIILTRYISKTDESYSMPALNTKLGLDYFQKALDITIEQKIEKGNLLKFKPYCFYGYDYQTEKHELELNNLGLDIQFLPGPASSVKLSLNPDYTDIPPDDEIATFNLKYEPVYPESRFFFIEDMNVFGVDYNTFYTRKIIKPLYAFKITANTKKYSWGVLSALENSDLASDKDFFNILAFNPTGETYRINSIILSRFDQEHHNEVLILAPELEILKHNYIYCDARLSYSDCSEKSKNGYHGFLGYEHLSRFFQLKMQIQQMSPNYHLSMGKIYEDDFYGWTLESSKIVEFNRKIFREMVLDLYLSEEIDNSSSSLLERIFDANLHFELDYHLDLAFNFKQVRELYEDKYFTKQRLGINCNWDYLKWLHVYFGANAIRSLIYSLSQTESGTYWQIGLKGNIGYYFEYDLALDAEIYSDMPVHPSVSDHYLYFNGDLIVNLSNKISLTSGFRVSDQKYYQYGDHRGIFFNLRFKMYPESNIFLGFKKSQNEIYQKITTDYEQIFLKITHTF